MSQETSISPSVWPHRLAVCLTCATFPLIWVGGLVTTYDAGMAVPDWPTTFGYNLFLYPWQTWLWGPWDLFIEHGHRLLGATVGFLTVGLAAALWAGDRRRWMGWLGLAAVAGVIFQGVLGGLRVRLDERLFAQIHGCVGPAFFAFAAALAVMTSRRWRTADENRDAALPTSSRLPRMATATAAMVYLQLALGSQLRHVQVTADWSFFRLAVWFHLLLAAALAIHVPMLWIRAWRDAPNTAWLRRPAHFLLVLIAAQIALGCGAWVVNYGWPAWLAEYGWAARYVVQRESLLQAMVTTGHVAVGSLILAVSVVLTLRSHRLLSMKSATVLSSSLPLSLSRPRNFSPPRNSSPGAIA